MSFIEKTENGLWSASLAWRVDDWTPDTWNAAASVSLGLALALAAVACVMFVLWDIRMTHRVLSGKEKQRQIEDYASRRGSVTHRRAPDGGRLHSDTCDDSETNENACDDAAPDAAGAGVVHDSRTADADHVDAGRVGDDTGGGTADDVDDETVCVAAGKLSDATVRQSAGKRENAGTDCMTATGMRASVRIMAKFSSPPLVQKIPCGCMDSVVSSAHTGDDDDTRLVCSSEIADETSLISPAPRQNSPRINVSSPQ